MELLVGTENPSCKLRERLHAMKGVVLRLRLFDLMMQSSLGSASTHT